MEVFQMRKSFKRFISAISAFVIAATAIPTVAMPALAANSAGTTVVTSTAELLNGDINKDGTIDNSDVTALSQAINKKTTSTLVNADLNGDSKVNNADTLLIKNYVSGKIKYFPVGDYYKSGVKYTTRGEWVHKLVTTFDMSVDDKSTMTNFFTDISGNAYAEDIKLAANFGLFDSDEDTFEPDSMVTREFAAHTANYCAGFITDETVSFSDSDDIYYEDDAVTAVLKGWFKQVDKEFRPNLLMTSTESAIIFKSLNKVNSEVVIDENAPDVVEYTDSVIQLDNSVKASLNGNKITINSDDVSIIDGDIFTVNVNGSERVYKAESVSTVKNGAMIVEISNVPMEEAFKSLSIQGVGDVDYDNIKVYNDETTSTVKNANTYSVLNGYSIQSDESSFNIKPISIKKTIDLDGAKIELSSSIDNIVAKYKWDFEWLSLKEFYFKIDADANLTAKASFNTTINKSKSKEVPIASLPVGLKFGLSAEIGVYATVNLSGEVKLNYKWGMMGGVAYDKSNGWRVVNDFHKKSFTLEAKINESVAVKAAAALKWNDDKFGEIYIMGGEKGSISVIKRENDIDCADLRGYVFAEIGAWLNLFGKECFNKSYEFINESNSPFKFHFHWEDDKLVDKCTYGTDTSSSTNTNKKTKYAYKNDYNKYGTEYEGIITLSNSADSLSDGSKTIWSDPVTLTEDQTINGDLYIDMDTLNEVDLNGHTLTVNGDVIQTGGAMRINSGTLNANADYILSNKRHYDEKLNAFIDDSTGDICIENTNDVVNIAGNFITYSNSPRWGYHYNDHEYTVNCFQKGVMTIKGNLYQYSVESDGDGSKKNFQPSDDFNLIFDGCGVHEMHFDSKESYPAGLKEINGATVKFTGVLCGFKLMNDIIVSGDMQLEYGYMKLNEKTLTINGDLKHIGGTMYIDSGVLNVNGSYYLGNKTHYDEKEGKYILDSSGDLYMENANDIITISGDFDISTERNDYYDVNRSKYDKGIMTIKGNFYQHSGDGVDDGVYNNYYPNQATFSLVFDGNKKHIFSSDSSYSGIGKITLSNGAKISFKGSLLNITNIENAKFTATGSVISDGSTILPVSNGAGTVTISGSESIKSDISFIVNGYEDKQIIADINNDGKADISDAVMLKKYLVKPGKLTSLEWDYADLNNDGKVNVIDLIVLKRILLKAI